MKAYSYIYIQFTQMGRLLFVCTAQKSAVFGWIFQKLVFLARLTTAVSPFYHGINQWGSSTTDAKMLREADSFHTCRCRMAGTPHAFRKL